MADPKQVPGTLYINRDRDYRTGAWGPYVKLGIVRNERQAEDRNSEHQTGNPRQVVTLHQFRAPMVENLETQLHHRFAPLCVSGEWFEMDDAFLAAEVLPLVESIIQEQANAADYFEGKAQLKNVVSSGHIRPPTDEEKAVWQAAVTAKENLTRAQAAKTCADYRLRALVADSGGIEGIVRLSTKDQSARFSGSAFEKAYPEIAKQFTIEKPAKVTGAIRLTGPASLKKLDEALKADLDTTTKARPTFSAAQANQTAATRSDVHIHAHAVYVESLRAVAEAEWHFNRHQAHLVHLLGTDDGIEGCVTWKRVEKPQFALDTTALQEQHPDLYAECIAAPRVTVSVEVLRHRPYALP